MRLKALTSDDEKREATQLVRELVRRVVVLPGEEDEPQGLEIEAGLSPVRTPADRDCNYGCGGWI